MNEFSLPQGDLLVAPERQAWVEATLNRLAEPEFAQTFTQKVNAAAEDGDDDDFWDPRMSWIRPYQVKDGVLTVPVQGLLLDGFPYQFGGFATGYEYVTAAVERGVADPQVREIVLDVDSPGGTVAGCFDCADAIHAARGAKPIHAVANESAYSAAYALASSAHDITVARTGGVGSIGVITAHISMSRALEARGLDVTLIFAGKHKADGHPALPLSDDAEARVQARIDALYEIFVSTVARNRDMDAQAVRDTEAATYMAREAIEIGLADAVGGLDSLSANADPLQTDEDEEMSKDNASTVEQAVTPEALAAATAEATASGEAAGRTAERERIAAILDSDEAAKRPVAARQVAMNTDMDVEKATAFLASLKEESSEEAANAPSPFETAMETGTQPELGAEAGAEMDEDEKFLAAYRGFLGR